MARSDEEDNISKQAFLEPYDDTFDDFKQMAIQVHLVWYFISVYSGDTGDARNIALRV